MNRSLLTALVALWLTQAGAIAPPTPDTQPRDAIARVGDQVIRFSELTARLNSAAVGGLSVPALGSRGRARVMGELLDTAITVNLLYLDAVRHGKDRDPDYQRDLRTFANGVLGGLYRARYLADELEVTPREVDAHFREHMKADNEMTDRVRIAIAASLRNHKFKRRTDGMRAQLRDDVALRVYAANLEPSEDRLRADAEAVAQYAGRRIPWAEVKGLLTRPVNSRSVKRRLAALDNLIDQELMAHKARETGLEADPVYATQMTEFRKTRLVNQHRADLLRDWEPAERELLEYFHDNRECIRFQERRRILMVVLKTREHAEAVKRRIQSGEITIHQAAADYSIHPKARYNLGDVGWVEQGTGFPPLDEVTFSLTPDELGGPVESPAGWHLVQVTDVRNPRSTNMRDEETRQAVRRRLLEEKLTRYLVELGTKEFPVVVDEDKFKRLLDAEVPWIAARTNPMAANPEHSQQQMEALGQITQ